MGIKEAMFAAMRQRKEEVVAVDSPTLGTVYLRSMRGWQLTEWQKKSGESSYPARGKALCYCMCDSDGGEISFTDAEVIEIDSWPTKVTEPLLNIALKASGLSDDEREDAIKNLNRQSGTSG